MDLAIIVAMARNGVIGNNNQLPWHLPEDLKHFKAVTLGKALIMGRKTFESIGRPLPGRVNIVVTRQPGWRPDGVLVATDIARAVALAERESPAGAGEIMVIGGGEIYRQTLPGVRRLYVTRVDVTVEGDTIFPPISPEEWRLRESETACSAANGVGYRLELWERIG